MASATPSKMILKKTQPVKANQKAPLPLVRRRKKRSSRQETFIVLGLLTIIVSGLLFGFTSASSAVKTTASLSPKDRKIFKDVSIYLEDFKEIYDTYPGSFSDLMELDWITDQPHDQYANPIQFQLESGGASYTLRSVGKDKKMGTVDDGCLRSVTSNKVSLHFYTCNL